MNIISIVKYITEVIFNLLYNLQKKTMKKFDLVQYLLYTFNNFIVSNINYNVFLYNKTGDIMEQKAKLGSIPRQAMPEQDAKRRATNFEEVFIGYTEENAKLEAQRCLQCKKPFCMDGCPACVKIPDFIALVAEGKYIEAAQKIKETNSLPGVCGRVCPQETQCEELCIVGKKFEPVAIGKLEMFVADYERKHSKKEAQKIEQNGKSVAVIGAGPAGIACANDLILLGYDVTVFEALHTLGGVLVYGIPEFRLPNAVVAFEVEGLKKLGVKFETNIAAGISVEMDELLEKYDAVFLGTGAGLPVFLGIPGEHYGTVYSANEYLTRSNLMSAYDFPKVDTPIIRHKSIAILGGGNVAMDACRTAIRLGAEHVYCVYRRTEKEMPARLEEVHHAKEEGVEMRILRSPIEVLGNDKGEVIGLRTQVMELGEPDKDGRCSPIAVEGKEEIVDIDAVVVAIGTTPNPMITRKLPEIKRSKWGAIIVDENGMTSKKGLFAGGDAARGSATVILAIGDGKQAAAGIHKYLS